MAQFPLPKTDHQVRARLASFGLPLLLLSSPLHAASMIQFSTTAFLVKEDAGQIEIKVLRTNDINTVVSVDFATTNLTATPGEDYVDVATNLTFLAGQTIQIVTVPILNDGLIERREMFQASLNNPTGEAFLGIYGIAQVIITDNDQGMQMEFASYWALEDEAFVQIGVVRGDDSNGPVSVECATADITAKAGADYTATSRKLDFTAGEKLKLVTIPILNDGLKEANETFRLHLTNAMGSVLTNPSSVTITIRDNDPGVQFESNTNWVSEDEGILSLRVLRGNDFELGAFTADYATSNGTALAGQDYAETQGTLEFAAGELEKLLMVPITHDEAAEPDEKFTVTLSNPTGPAALGRYSKTTVILLDATGMVAHRFEDLSVLPGQGAQLTMGGGVNARFKDYFDLYPIEVSPNLVDWTSLVTLQRINAATNALTWLDTEASKLDRRFYRTITNNVITPFRPPTGPFPVGVVSRLVNDPSRRNRYAISTNGSFMMSLWYPAVAECGRLPGQLNEAALSKDPAYWAGALMDSRACVVSYALGDARCASHQSPYPVVLFSSGWTGVRRDVAEQGPNLASHGYVVVAVDHCDAYGTVFPDGTYLYGDWLQVPDTTTAGFQDRVRDWIFVLEELDRWNRSDPAFAGRLDLSRVATMGGSWGGGVAGELGRIDDRVKAVILLDAYLQNADDLVRVGLSKPFLGMYSTEGGGDTTLYNHKAAQRAIWFLNKYLKGLDEPIPAKADYPRVTGLRQK